MAHGKAEKTGIKNIRKTCCRIAARNAAERRMNMSTTGIIRPKSDIATQNGASQPCIRFSEHFFRWRNTWNIFGIYWSLLWFL